MKEYVDLFLTWAKIGGFSYGGGYAMLPLIINEISNKKNWATEDEIMDYYAISQCTPGVIAVNIATFIGKKRKGVLGGIIATLGVITPSIIIITIIAVLLKKYSDLAIVKHALNGIYVAECVLMTRTVIKLGKNALKDIKTIAIFVAAFICAFYLNVSTIVISLGTILIALLMYKLGDKSC